MNRFSSTLLNAMAILLISQGARSQPSKLTAKYLDSVGLFNNEIMLSKNAPIFIYNPSKKPLGDAWQYEWIYTSFMERAPGRSTALQGMTKLYCVIKSFFMLPNSDIVYAIASPPKSDAELYINLKEALLTGEIELGGMIPLQFSLFRCYIKTLRSISDEDVITFINAFMPIKGMNEFEQQKYLSNIKAQMNELKNGPLNLKDQRYVGILNVGTYDFKKKGFPISGYDEIKQFDLPISNTVNRMVMAFQNIKPDILLPIGPENAEKLANKYFKDGNRRLYYVYNFDFTGNETNSLFVETAEVKSIDLYADITLTTKLTTIAL